MSNGNNMVAMAEFVQISTLQSSRQVDVLAKCTWTLRNQLESLQCQSRMFQIDSRQRAGGKL